MGRSVRRVPPSDGVESHRALHTLAVSIIWLYTLPSSVSACSDPWVDGDRGCFRVTTEKAPHWNCESLCGPDASLACVSTLADTTRLAEAASGAWLGHFRSAAGNWECSSDAPSTWTQWAPGEPAVAEFECARMAASNLRKRGKWESALCSEERSCVCALGANASTAYNATRLKANAAVVTAEDAAMGARLVHQLVVGLGVWTAICLGIFFHLYRVCKQRLAAAGMVEAPAPAARPVAEAADVAMGGDVSDVTDSSLVATAETKLKAAREAAASVRRSINIASGLAIVFALVVLFPLILLLIFYELPFGPAGVAYVVVLTIAIPSQYDPTMPRRVRAMLAAATLHFFPFFAGVFAALAIHFPLTPDLFGICSTRKPLCALGARLLAGACASFSCAMVVYAIAGIPALYPVHDTSLPPIKELLQKQKRAIAEDGAIHPCQHRSNPAYLLEGAHFFAMPVHMAMDRFFLSLQGIHLLCGPVLCVISISLFALDLAPIHLTWGGFFPLGLAFGLFFPVACSPPARRAIVSWLGRLGTEGEARQAAAVAGLLGGVSPAKVLAYGRTSFRGMKPRTALTSFACFQTPCETLWPRSDPQPPMFPQAYRSIKSHSLTWNPTRTRVVFTSIPSPISRSTHGWHGGAGSVRARQRHRRGPTPPATPPQLPTTKCSSFAVPSR